MQCAAKICLIRGLFSRFFQDGLLINFEHPIQGSNNWIISKGQRCQPLCGKASFIFFAPPKTSTSSRPQCVVCWSHVQIILTSVGQASMCSDISTLLMRSTHTPTASAQPQTKHYHLDLIHTNERHELDNYALGNVRSSHGQGGHLRRRVRRR